jgi:hypothetical protein
MRMVKVDVEGWESKVLCDGANVIDRCKPSMTISAYHYAQDIPDIVVTVEDITRYQHVGLRRYTANLFDSKLVFSNRQNFR